MKSMLRSWTAAGALAVSTAALSATPSSANYALPSSTINSGVGDMASANYKASSSLGDPFFAAPLGSANYKINPGFWGAVIGPLPLCLLDIDGDGNADALTDGLMLIRAMFGLTGTAVTNNATAPTAPRQTWAEIQPYIHFAALDLDGSGTTDALTDGLMLIRAMFGLIGTSVTINAVTPGAPRADWTAIRGYLNTSCGANYAP
ncbi:MAG: hypothetical protein KAX84_03665 [Burkholderiales bacterium]|nr:hypothetical protein [Betaproteobacteria bacterium]MBP8295179.1 hypothetical protein [Burkholderiales bacterium]